ncbi:MAG TPA: hypothetical protein VIN57_06395, partial [Magnetovibrio sp.]
MTGIFTVTRKLLLLWGSSTALAIALVGGIFAYSMNTYYDEVANHKIQEGFQAVRSHLLSEQDQLQTILQGFAERSDVQSGIGMISKYQKIESYQPLVFDTEKKQLASQLGELIGISGHHYYGLYDAENRLAAYHYEVLDLVGRQEKVGFISYENGNPVIMEGPRGEDAAPIVVSIPKILSQAAPTQQMSTSQTVISGFDGGLLMAHYVPIERQRKVSGNEYLGTVLVVDV